MAMAFARPACGAMRLTSRMHEAQGLLPRLSAGLAPRRPGGSSISRARGSSTAAGSGSGSGGSIKPPVGGSGGSAGEGGSGSPWDAYLHWLDTAPLLTKSLTSALMNALGDIICQMVVEKKSKEQLDGRRIAIFAGLGLVLVGPILHFWYATVLSNVVPFGGVKGTIIKTAMDQLLFAPCFISLFLGSLMGINGAGLPAIQAKLQQDLVPTVKANWTLWIPVQIINFTFMPVKLQVLFSNVVSLVWTVYLSWTANKPALVAAKALPAKAAPKGKGKK